MLIFFYNLLQIFALIILWPVLLILIASKKKYGRRMLKRLGFGILPLEPASASKTFWLHALSVGEITSAVPLLSGLRREWPDCRIIVTVTTTSGEALAQQTLTSITDKILPAPLDIRPTIRRYIKTIQPDFYIHVETDFWPNLLSMLHKGGVPTLLVNGRISQNSLDSYKKYGFFFTPMFRSFSTLCMQTGQDQQNMISLGIDGSKIKTLGNLKFDTPALDRSPNTELLSILPENRLIITAGSTHPGEEDIIIDAYRSLCKAFPETLLAIAPRNPDRGREIAGIAENRGFACRLRSENRPVGEEQVLIVDTIGELIDLYRNSAVGFVGGSLVPSGGHNPIEPALFGIPVLIGPHMDDFTEISQLLLESGGCFTVHNHDDLSTQLKTFLDNPEERKQKGQQCLQAIEQQKGVIDKHIELIRHLL